METLRAPDRVAAAALEPAIRFDVPARIRAVIIAALFIAVFWELFDFIPTDFSSWNGLGKLTNQWFSDADWSHGPLIPLFSAYLVYINWDRIKRCPIRHAWVGLPVLIAGLAAYCATLAGPAGPLPFQAFKPLAMMLTLLGIIVFLNGVPVMRYALVPWLYLFFAIPLPKRIYFEVTTPLRSLVAWVTAKVLSVVPDLYIRADVAVIDYDYNGRIGKIGVVDACSGIRGLITLLAIGVAVAFLTPRPWWQRLVMIVMCGPIAMFCNFLRVIATAVLQIFVDSKYAEGSYHMALGLVTLGIGFGLFSALGWALQNLFVDSDEDDAATNVMEKA